MAHLVATEPEEVGGKFTGKVSGTPCFREGKVTRVEQWLAAQGRRWERFCRNPRFTAIPTTICRCWSGSRTRLRSALITPLRQAALARGWEIIALD